MGSEFQIIFKTLAILALATNLLFLILSAPYIIENYDTQSTMLRIRLELYLTIHLLLSGCSLSYIFYEGFRNGQIIYFSTIFSIIGIVFVLFGSLINVPYSSIREVRKDYSHDYTNYIYNIDDNKRAAYGNGTLKAIPISPNSSEMYVWLSYGEDNMSIVQIDVGTTGKVLFTLAELDWETKDIRHIFFNWTFRGADPILDWYTRFWTTPYESRRRGLVFENPNDFEITVSFRVTEFYLKATREVKEIYYDNLFLDQNYAYGGLVLLGVSVVLKVLFWLKKSKVTLKPTNSKNEL